MQKRRLMPLQGKLHTLLRSLLVYEQRNLSKHFPLRGDQWWRRVKIRKYHKTVLFFGGLEVCVVGIVRSEPRHRGCQRMKCHNLAINLIDLLTFCHTCIYIWEPWICNNYSIKEVLVFMCDQYWRENDCGASWNSSLAKRLESSYKELCTY